MTLRLPFAIAGGFLIACTLAHSECRLVRIAQWPVNDRMPIVEGSVNGQKVGVLLDTGADTTLLSRSGAMRLGLPREATEGIRSYGFGGESRVEIAEIAEFRIGSAVRKDWRVLAVGEHDLGPDVAMLLGDDFLENFDIELDFPGKAIRLFQALDCAGSSLAYWAPRVASYVDIQPGRQVVFSVTINGAALNALLDTGAARSVLARQVAESVGIKPDGPETQPAGCFVGLGKARADGSFVPVKAFSVGGETIRDTHLAVADFGRALRQPETGSRLGKGLEGFPVLVLGMDFIRAHRVLVSRSQRKVYFTPNGETVFPTTPGRACNAPAPDPDARIARSEDALQANPADPVALLRRARALVDKGDLDAALVDFERVLALRPDDPNALFSRAAILHRKKEYERAIEGYDAFLARKPGDRLALQYRAAARMMAGRLDGAIADANEVLSSDPRNESALHLRGVLHYAAGRYDAAARDLAEWQRLHPDAYPALWLYLARLRMGQDGSTALFNYRRETQPTKWPGPIMRFHLGEMNAEELLAEAARGGDKRRDEECEARFHMAQRRIVANDMPSAIGLLREAAEACPTNLDEYYSANAELKRLQ